MYNREHWSLDAKIEAIAHSKASATWARVLRTTYNSEEALAAEARVYEETRRELRLAHGLAVLPR